MKQHREVKTVRTMDRPAVSEQKAHLSFSIENILREDFPNKRSLRAGRWQKTATYGSRIQRWPYTPVYYAVRYSPVIMQLLPNMRDSQANPSTPTRGKEQALEQSSFKTPNENCLKSNTETCQENEDEISAKDEKQEECAGEKGAKRKRRNRSHFTQRQLQYLERIFSRQQYLTRDERTLLARGLEMTELQIRNWFQNRRYQKKNRATDKKEQDELDSTACVKGKAC